jgi:polar amino acid transport system substrate-binding protein
MKMGSPRAALAALVLVVAITAGTSASSSAAGHEIPIPPPVSKCKQLVKLEVRTKGKLTVATDSPALAPWFEDNLPGNQKGYESGVAYHIATTLGLKTSQVVWYAEPYWKGETAGAKPFDFDINEFIYSAKLTSKVTFSKSYFNVNQSLVSVKGNAIVARHSPSALKTYLYGDVKGSPGLAFIENDVKPSRAPLVYSTLALAIAALEAKKIDAIVVDTPSGQYIASQQLTDGVQVAQFHTTTEHYAIVLQRRNPLAACVDSALAAMTRKGELRTLSKLYLSIYNSIPVIKP